MLLHLPVRTKLHFKCQKHQTFALARVSSLYHRFRHAKAQEDWGWQEYMRGFKMVVCHNGILLLARKQCFFPGPSSQSARAEGDWHLRQLTVAHRLGPLQGQPQTLLGRLPLIETPDALLCHAEPGDPAGVAVDHVLVRAPLFAPVACLRSHRRQVDIERLHLQ